MRQTSPLSRPTHDGLVRESLQVAAYPCWDEALPEVISPICVEVLGPVPRRASSVQLLLPQKRKVFWAAGPFTPRNARVVTHHGLWYRYVSESGN